jgi:hypothetical protein
MRRRTGIREYVPWRLAFEEGGRRGWFNMRPTPLQWEVVNVRGADMSVADVDVVGFGQRKLVFGEGPIVRSPADAGRML